MLEKVHPGMLNYMSADDEVDDPRSLSGGGRTEPTWAHFWSLVPADVRNRIETGELTGRNAILSCVERSGTTIEDLSHPLARCLPEPEQEMLRTGTGTFTIGMGNGYSFSKVRGR